VIGLLSVIIGALAVLAQMAVSSRQQIREMEARVRTLIELREAGAFGTGGFGRDKPVGEEGFTTDTLEAVKRIPNARHIARIDEYVYEPEIDASKGNAYAMIIGLPPGSALRAIGEIDYENARIIAGRSLALDDASKRVAVVGSLYARQRLGLNAADTSLRRQTVTLNGTAFEVVGIYSTANDFGDNHVFIPIEAFRATYRPGNKLSKIFVTVDSVANVDRVVADLRRLPEADVVTTPEAVSTARTTLGGLAAASTYSIALLFAVGAVLVIFIMVLSVRERVREIGMLKAIGASSRELISQFLAEATTLCLLGGIGGAALAALGLEIARSVTRLSLSFQPPLVLTLVAGTFAFAGLASIYPILKARRLSPVEAMRSVE
jgi:ABC-type antimicrobial peptide transport system permease subunit